MILDHLMTSFILYLRYKHINTDKVLSNHRNSGSFTQDTWLNCTRNIHHIRGNQIIVNIFSENVRNRFNIGNSFCILFAPTFRGYGEIKTFPPLTEVEYILKEKTGRDVVILLRKHHADHNQYSIPGITMDVSDYPDMQELICCSDLLITDYSSTMWEFALLGRPCYLFVPDRKEYEKDRGFYTPIEEWPGIICNNADEFLAKISNLDFDYSRKIAEQYLQKSESYETGHAAESIANVIVKHIEFG